MYDISSEPVICQKAPKFKVILRYPMQNNKRMTNICYDLFFQRFEVFQEIVMENNKNIVIFEIF